MKKTFILVSVILNIILISIILKYELNNSSRHLRYCQNELKETLYLLDLANSILKKPSNKLEKSNPYFYNLHSLSGDTTYLFEQNPKIDVISHSSEYNYLVEVDSENFIKHIGWYKP